MVECDSEKVEVASSNLAVATVNCSLINGNCRAWSSNSLENYGVDDESVRGRFLQFPQYIPYRV